MCTYTHIPSQQKMPGTTFLLAKYPFQITARGLYLFLESFERLVQHILYVLYLVLNKNYLISDSCFLPHSFL